MTLSVVEIWSGDCSPSRAVRLLEEDTSLARNFVRELSQWAGWQLEHWVLMQAHDGYEERDAQRATSATPKSGLHSSDNRHSQAALPPRRAHEKSRIEPPKTVNMPACGSNSSFPALSAASLEACCPKQKKRVKPTPVEPSASPAALPPAAAPSLTTELIGKSALPSPATRSLMSRSDTVHTSNLAVEMIAQSAHDVTHAGPSSPKHVAASGLMPSTVEPEPDEAGFTTAIAAAAAQHKGLANLASLHATLLLEGWVAYVPAMHMAVRCMLMPPVVQSPASDAEQGRKCNTADSVKPAAADQPARKEARLRTAAEACAYSAILLRLAGNALELLDARLVRIVMESPRLAAPVHLPQVQRLRKVMFDHTRPCHDTAVIDTGDDAVDYRRRVKESMATTDAPDDAQRVQRPHEQPLHQPQLEQKPEAPPPQQPQQRLALKAHVLPADWIAQPTSSSHEYTSVSEQQLWRNRQRLFDILLSLQETYPAGFHGGMGSAQPDLRDACKELLRTVLPENVRWLARFITQQLVQNCLGFEMADAAQAVRASNSEHESATRTGTSACKSTTCAGGRGFSKAGSGAGRGDRRFQKLSDRMSAKPMQARPSQLPRHFIGQLSSQSVDLGANRGQHCASKINTVDGKTSSSHAAGSASEHIGDRHMPSASPSPGLRWFAQGTCEFFWYRLLISLDSHLLAAQLAATWTAHLWDAASGVSAHLSDDASKGRDGDDRTGSDTTVETCDEEQCVLRCCVLSKYLGLLIFSPGWQQPTGAYEQMPAAAPTSKSESSFISLGLQPHALVEAAVRSNRLPLCLPWLSGLLRMSIEDRTSVHLATYKSSLRAIATLSACTSLLPLPSPPDCADVGTYASSCNRQKQKAVSKTHAKFMLLMVVQELSTALKIPHPLFEGPPASSGRTGCFSAETVPIAASGSAIEPNVSFLSRRCAACLDALSDVTVAALSSLLVDRRCVEWACPSLRELRSLLKVAAQGRKLRCTVAQSINSGSNSGLGKSNCSSRSSTTRKITPTCTASVATLSASTPGITGTFTPSVFDSPAASPSVSRSLSSCSLITAPPAAQAPSSVGHSGINFDGTPVASRHVEHSLVERLQELQHSHFWRQHRELFGAVNSILEPLQQTVCADATSSISQRVLSAAGSASEDRPSQWAIHQAAVADAHGQAEARLTAAVRALLPRDQPPEVALHAVSQLLPIMRASISRLLPLRAASLLAKMPAEKKSRAPNDINLPIPVPSSSLTHAEAIYVGPNEVDSVHDTSRTGRRRELFSLEHTTVASCAAAVHSERYEGIALGLSAGSKDNLDPRHSYALIDDLAALIERACTTLGRECLETDEDIPAAASYSCQDHYRSMHVAADLHALLSSDLALELRSAACLQIQSFEGRVQSSVMQSIFPELSAVLPVSSPTAPSLPEKRLSANWQNGPMRRLITTPERCWPKLAASLADVSELLLFVGLARWTSAMLMGLATAPTNPFVADMFHGFQWWDSTNSSFSEQPQNALLRAWRALAELERVDNNFSNGHLPSFGRHVGRAILMFFAAAHAAQEQQSTGRSERSLIDRSERSLIDQPTIIETSILALHALHSMGTMAAADIACTMHQVLADARLHGTALERALLQLTGALACPVKGGTYLLHIIPEAASVFLLFAIRRAEITQNADLRDRLICAAGLELCVIDHAH